MASIFDVGGLLGPIAPGMSGAVNPLAFIGSGMARGDVGSALAEMGELQMAAQDLALRQQQQAQQMAALAERRRQAEAAQAQQAQLGAAAQALAGQAFPAMPGVGPPTAAGEVPMLESPQARAAQILAGAMPEQFLQSALQRQGIFAPPPGAEPPAAIEAFQYYQQMSPENQQAYQEYRQAMSGPGVTIQNVQPPPAGYRYKTGSIEVGQPELEKIKGGPAEAKEKAEQRKLLRPVEMMEASVAAYRRQLEKVGPEVMPGAEKLKLQAAYTDMLLNAKELANLGALQGPDLELIQRVIEDPTTLRAQGLGKEALLEQLQLVDEKTRAARQTVTGQRTPPPPGFVED